jgi:hypothetical protein
MKGNSFMSGNIDLWIYGRLKAVQITARLSLHVLGNTRCDYQRYIDNIDISEESLSSKTFLRDCRIPVSLMYGIKRESWGRQRNIEHGDDVVWSLFRDTNIRIVHESDDDDGLRSELCLVCWLVIHNPKIYFIRSCTRGVKTFVKIC